MASKLAKYSGLLEPHQENILNRFIQDHNISKAKVIGLLLENWEKENYPKYQDSDRPVKFSELNELVNSLLDERLKSFNINNLNLVNNLVSSKDDEVSSIVSNQVSNDTEVSNKVSSEVSSNGYTEVSNEVKNEVTNLDENQLPLLFEEKEAIGNDDLIGEDVLEIAETLPDIGLTVIGEGNIEVMPSENELESSAIDEGTITPEVKNDEVNGESERVNLETTEKKLTEKDRLAILNAIPKGTQFLGEDLLKMMELKYKSDLRPNRGNKEKPRPNPYLRFFDVETLQEKGNPKRYTRNDYVLVR